MYLLFVVMGWVCIYEASYDSSQMPTLNFAHRSVMQLIWIGTCFIAAAVILSLNINALLSLANVIYGAVVLLLIITVFLAPNIKGSHSWLVLGPVSVQPAEFAKFATALALAKLISSPNYKFFPASKKVLLIVLLICLPVSIILMQNETGTALVFLAFALMLYREGLPQYVLLTGLLLLVVFITIILSAHSTTLGSEGDMGRFIDINLINIIAIIIYNNNRGRDNSFKTIYLIIAYMLVFLSTILINKYFIKVNFVNISLLLSGGFVSFLIFYLTKTFKLKYLWVILFVIGFIGYAYLVEFVYDDVMKEHQRTRIEVFLGMKDDPKGAEWNVNQSKIAIGSGGLFGKGFLKGTQTKLKFVPEQDTDFIFCTIGEELGFAGSSVVIAMFIVFLFRLIKLAERQLDTAAKVYGYCVAGIFMFHILINIGMVLGVMPVIGIPLPFYSYGGSSLLAFTILLFIFLRFDAQRFSSYYN
jgi:rod shape determining protein RodA